MGSHVGSYMSEVRNARWKFTTVFHCPTPELRLVKKLSRGGGVLFVLHRPSLYCVEPDIFIKIKRDVFFPRYMVNNPCSTVKTRSHCVHQPINQYNSDTCRHHDNRQRRHCPPYRGVSSLRRTALSLQISAVATLHPYHAVKGHTSNLKLDGAGPRYSPSVLLSRLDLSSLSLRSRAGFEKTAGS